MEAIHHAITAGHEMFMAAFRKGDAVDMVACYTTDAKLFPPHRQTITGAQGIKAFWQGEMNRGIKEQQLETIAVELHADLAVEVGAYRVTIQPESGERMTDTGT
jgi:ketosteroid isomerase-like protein